MAQRKRSLSFEALETRTLLSGTTPMEPSTAEQIEVAPAFPGAEGFGAQTVGGRGGEVIEVTNLNDSGPGSLRAAIEAEGPRIVVFRVNGTIELDKSLKIENPYITLAGQSAPGNGITLKNYELSIRTHDVIVRYLRIRTGDTVEEDSISLVGAENVILDHNSFSWSTDENASATRGSKNITIQWNIISEGLRDSTHPDGPHSNGSLFSGVTNLSLHHNLYAHNDSRSARLGKANDDYGTQLVDMVNNVIYNWGERATEVKDYVDANIVANYYKAGPDTVDALEINTPEVVLVGDDIQRSIYIDGNYGPECNGDCEDDWHLVGEKDGDPADRQFQSLTRHDAPVVTTTSAQTAYDQVLAQAGARLPFLDSIDERIIENVMDGTGEIIDDPSEVGGWLEWDPAAPPADSDHDGMPDEWEKRYGFDPHDADDSRLDADGDGYTNVEEWLNSTVPVKEEAPEDPPDDSTETADDNASTDEDTSVNIDVLANDNAGSGGALALDAVTQGSYGAVVVNSDQTITYTPDADFNGDDSFTYTVIDDNGDRHAATVTVVVNAVNDAPVAVDDSTSTPQATPVTIDVLSNDSDVDGDHLAVSSITPGDHGSVTINPDQTLTYLPEAAFVGSDTFSYTVTDLSGATRTASVSVTVTSRRPTLHVADLDAEGVIVNMPDWKGVATIVVHDALGSAVSGARVTGTFRQGHDEIEVTCVTGADGICIVDSGMFPSRRGNATFTIDLVEHPDYQYVAKDNEDPDGGSGTSIYIKRRSVTNISDE